MVKIDVPVLTGSQLRAARALLDITAVELATETMIEVKTIRRAEARNHQQVLMTAANKKRIAAALEARGVQFIPANGGGPGVRLAKNPAQDGGGLP
jgi:transcriptional regulator with XRE-family HTH domain